MFWELEKRIYSIIANGVFNDAKKIELSKPNCQKTETIIVRLKSF